MQPHEQRVVDEHKELVAKLSRLVQFMETDLYHGLSFDEQHLLARQCRVMHEYSSILALRINAFAKDAINA